MMTNLALPLYGVIFLGYCYFVARIMSAAYFHEKTNFHRTILRETERNDITS